MVNSFVDRAKDTLKVSGAQVSPTEIEDVLRAHPDKLIADVCVAGVSGGRTSDEKNPRAWLVLSEDGKKLGVEKTLETLDAWTRQNLSKYKWLRGGYEIVDQVSTCFIIYRHSDGRILLVHRYRSLLQGKYSVVCCRMHTSSGQLRKPSYS